MDLSPASVPSCFSQLSVRKPQGFMGVRDHISKCLNSHMKLCLVCKATCSIANKRHLTKQRPDKKTRSFIIYTEAAHDIFSLQLHESCLYVNVCSCWTVVMGSCWTSPVAQTALNHPLSLQFVITCSSQSIAVPVCTWSAPWLCSPVRCSPPALLGQSPFPRVPYLLGPGRAWAAARAAERERSGFKPCLTSSSRVEGASK